MHPKCHCHTEKNVAARVNNFSVFSSVLVALIPKCPFCMVAYSSAITVCGGKSLPADFAAWTSFLPVSLALFTLAVVLINYRDKRTLVAALMLAGGILLIIYSEFLTGGIASYYFGSALLVFGVWYNGSFLFFYYKVRNTILRMNL